MLVPSWHRGKQINGAGFPMSTSDCGHLRGAADRQKACRHNAELCRQMALESTDNEAREAWLMMADNWLAIIPHALIREWETSSPHARARRKAGSHEAKEDLI